MKWTPGCLIKSKAVYAPASIHVKKIKKLKDKTFNNFSSSIIASALIKPVWEVFQYVLHTALSLLVIGLVNG